MNILGISAGFHDAAASLIDFSGNILFAAHSERYSKRKHDANISIGLVNDIKQYDIDHIAYYEQPWLKQIRKIVAGQQFQFRDFFARTVLKDQLKLNGLFVSKTPYSCFNHHLSHAAAGFQTSNFSRATVVVIDAIGEFDTASIWAAEYDNLGRAKYTKLWSQKYPHSIGLFYSAVTERLGLAPMDEEYITMGMAAWGKPNWYEVMADQVIEDFDKIKFKNNLHIGFDEKFLESATNEDIACSAQVIVEDLIQNIMQRAANFKWSNNIVYMGGVALNCLANRHIGKYFDNIWVMPCPGDAGSSLGAAALVYRKQIHWTNAYLGHNIDGDYPVDNILNELLARQIAGVASGRAEFGPRALGNRSLLADPRGGDIKDRVNEIKRRQKFRPFAPIILEEHVDQYFDMPLRWNNSRYMQVIARCRRPDLYPAVCHVDDTSRVQTVPQDGSGIRRLLEAWYDRTGCPMLLNTSLNVRGEPMVNDRTDAQRFEMLYNVKVCT